MRKMMKLQVLMAGMYQIPKGKKIMFVYDRRYGLYLASSEGKTFGLVKPPERGKRRRLRGLGNTFSGSVIESIPKERKLIVKIRS